MKVLKTLGYVIGTLAFSGICGSLLLFHGPFPSVKEFVVDSLMTSRHGYLLKPLSLYTLPQSYLDAHSPVLANTNEKSNLNTYNVHDSSITVESYTAKTFSAKIMLIRDPKRLKVAVTKSLGNVGESVSQFVQENGAVAGVNGGAFADGSFKGTGGIPLGITISDGKVIEPQTGSQPVIGLTKDGSLIAGSYDTDELKSIGVTQALTYGPVLVQNREGMIDSDGGWGYAPRMAIGQREDGTIILIAADGRSLNEIGASMKDMQDLMLEYGAVVAANLDGGSSTTMVYNNQVVNNTTDILGERKVATAILVMPEGWEW